MNRGSTAQVYPGACDRYIPLAIKEGVYAASEARVYRSMASGMHCCTPTAGGYTRVMPPAVTSIRTYLGAWQALYQQPLSPWEHASRAIFSARYSFRQTGYTHVSTALNARLTQFDEVVIGPAALSQPTTMKVTSTLLSIPTIRATWEC